jgi:hypothetical protein
MPKLSSPVKQFCAPPDTALVAISVQCHDAERGGQWSFQYSVSKGPITERGLRRGDMPPANELLQPTSRC